MVHLMTLSVVSSSTAFLFFFSFTSTFFGPFLPCYAFSHMSLSSALYTTFR
jgi:hypothetical protein